MLANAAVARFAAGTSMQLRLAAEETFALKLADLGKAYQDAALMAMAAESLMNLSPWDYYQVSICAELTDRPARYPRFWCQSEHVAVQKREGFLVTLSSHGYGGKKPGNLVPLGLLPGSHVCQLLSDQMFQCQGKHVCGLTVGSRPWWQTA